MAKRGRRRRDDEGEGREGNGGQTRDEAQPQDLGPSSPTNPHLPLPVYPVVAADSPSKAYSNVHPQAVPVSCATLRVAKKLKEDENKNLIDSNVATPVDGTFPGTKDVANAEQMDSTFRPQTRGSEDCHSVAASASLDHLVNNVDPSVIPQVQNSDRSRYPLRRASLRLYMKVKRNENLINSAAKSADGSSPMTENVPTEENYTSQLPPQDQNLEESNHNPPLEHLNSTIAKFVPIVIAPGACIVNTSDPLTLKEAEMEPPTYTENRLDENGDSLSQNHGHLAQSLSFNLSKIVDLTDDGSSNQSEVDYPGNYHLLVTVEGYRVEAESAPTLRLILSKHGDIAANSSMESVQSRSSFLEHICGVIKGLEMSGFAELAIGDLERMRTVVRDAENVRINVNWLGRRLDDIIKAKQTLNNYAPLIKARNKNKEDTEEVKKELEALKEKVKLTEENLAAMEVEATKISRKLSEVKDEVKCFCQRSLVEGLL